jgi:hypothetical protein
MKISISDSAKEQLVSIMKESEFSKPALRLVINGVG